MRLNTVSAPVFTVPDSVPVQGVEAVRPADALKEDDPRRRERPVAPESSEPPAVPARVADAEERRHEQMRRGAERRQRQIPVLIDTRTGRDRRRSGRRESDPPATSVDFEA